MVSNAVSGSSAILWLGANTVAEWTKVDLSGKGKMIDVSSISDAAFESFIAGKRGSTISIEVLFVPGDVDGQLNLVNAWLAGEKLTGAKLPKLTRSTGGPNLSGDAYVENFQWGVPQNDKQSATFTLRFADSLGLCWH